MAYIGKQPVIGNFQKCDAISVVNGQAAYTLQVGGSNVSPQSENHMLVSLNGILQAPTDSFTVSGSTITFASALSTGDVIDFVMILGNVLDLGVPSDNTVSLAKLTATGTKDATTFLRGDNTFAEAGGGITEADQWRLTADFSSSAEITSNLERVDTYGNGYLGTGMTESSGVFTFPSTGYWLVMAQATIFSNQYGNTLLGILVTTDNLNYNYANQIRQGNANYGVSNEPNSTGFGFSIIDVTSTTNVKVKFRTGAFGSGSTLRGDTNTTITGFSFIRLGDT